mmetsp:Transcript_111708/g.320954  ORF Transcript_111708/g.320954 Transcript_111708/m.320954 type:complete len:222 (-) Transcript_111708:984-1649(-)
MTPVERLQKMSAVQKQATNQFIRMSKVVSGNSRNWIGIVTKSQSTNTVIRISQTIRLLEEGLMPSRFANAEQRSRGLSSSSTCAGDGLLLKADPRTALAAFVMRCVLVFVVFGPESMFTQTESTSKWYASDMLDTTVRPLTDAPVLGTRPNPRRVVRPRVKLTTSADGSFLRVRDARREDATDEAPCPLWDDIVIGFRNSPRMKLFDDRPMLLLAVFARNG